MKKSLGPQLRTQITYFSGNRVGNCCIQKTCDTGKANTDSNPNHLDSNSNDQSLRGAEENPPEATTMRKIYSFIEELDKDESVAQPNNSCYKAVYITFHIKDNTDVLRTLNVRWIDDCWHVSIDPKERPRRRREWLVLRVCSRILRKIRQILNLTP
jgi:hypothetical protein